ncbi:MAG: bacillithiol biosynthesis deacetylase BshB1 [Bacillota bacterium]|jgi:bacillithiol biosynthesis deacetylase BshB1
MKILVFGAHPDDVELSVGGIVARHAALGHEVEICDLTAGEMGSNGTPEQRLEEGREAAAILGAKARHNLGLPDAFLEPNREALLATAQLIRQVQPDIVLAPWWQDHHPDHVAASSIVTKASHLAGLHKYPVSGERHRPRRIFYYFLGQTSEPSFLVNIDEYWQVKLAAVQAHASQFAPRQGGARPTRLNREQFFEEYSLRFRSWGREIGCTYAEALVSPGRLAVADLSQV